MQQKQTLQEREWIAKQRIQKLRDNATVYELIFKRLLIESGEPFVFQKAFVSHTFNMIADFYLPFQETIVELDGKHHYEPEGLLRDSKRVEWLKTKGIKVIHIENKDVLKLNVNDVRRMLGLEEKDDYAERKQRVKKFKRKKFKITF